MRVAFLASRPSAVKRSCPDSTASQPSTWMPDTSRPEQQRRAVDWRHDANPKHTLHGRMLQTFDEIHPGQSTIREFLDNQAVDGPLNDTESYFTGQQRAWLTSYLRQCADTMLLNHWTLRLYHEAPTDGAHATVRATPGRYMASFRFESEIFQQDPEEARNHVAHELCHVIYEGATQMVDEDLDGILGHDALHVFKLGFHRQIEAATDHLAMVVSPGLPLPPWSSLGMDVITRKSNQTAQDAFQAASEREDSQPGLPEPTTAQRAPEGLPDDAAGTTEQPAAASAE